MNFRRDQYNEILKKLNYFQLSDHPLILNVIKLLKDWVEESFSIKKNVYINEINRKLCIRTDKNNNDIITVVLKCY
jgi:hypothetical protein